MLVWANIGTQHHLASQHHHRYIFSILLVIIPVGRRRPKKPRARWRRHRDTGDSRHIASIGSRLCRDTVAILSVSVLKLRDRSFRLLVNVMYGRMPREPLYWNDRAGDSGPRWPPGVFVHPCNHPGLASLLIPDTNALLSPSGPSILHIVWCSLDCMMHLKLDVIPPVIDVPVPVSSYSACNDSPGSWISFKVGYDVRVSVICHLNEAARPAITWNTPSDVIPGVVLIMLLGESFGAAAKYPHCSTYQEFKQSQICFTIPAKRSDHHNLVGTRPQTKLRVVGDIGPCSSGAPAIARSCWLHREAALALQLNATATEMKEGFRADLPLLDLSILTKEEIPTNSSDEKRGEKSLVREVGVVMVSGGGGGGVKGAVLAFIASSGEDGEKGGSKQQQFRTDGVVTQNPLTLLSSKPIAKLSRVLGRGRNGTKVLNVHVLLQEPGEDRARGFHQAAIWSTPLSNMPVHCTGPRWLRRSGFNPRPGNSRFLHVGIVPYNDVGRRIFSGISLSPRPFILALFHTRLSHPHRLSRPRC
ncbi:hypothetical protein PR048_019304 [Dryococelus australis]|uniref:Uncharacterized protein n=1 Tax=Dryococelus australis TaxID=614101 RepID=A0ABQ9H352_9NEOP|nr:hypothetical protein PR048_019304 [Dryococelus australis]